jgi:hypothetical protein
MTQARGQAPWLRVGVIAALAALAAVSVYAQTLVSCALEPKAQDEIFGIKRCPVENPSAAAEIRRAARELERKAQTRSGLPVVKLDAASIQAALKSRDAKSHPIQLPLVGNLSISLSGTEPVTVRSDFGQWRGTATLDGEGRPLQGAAFLAWSAGSGVQGTFEFGSRLFRFQRVWRDYYGLYETERTVLPLDHPVPAKIVIGPGPNDETPPFDDLNPPKPIAVRQGGVVDTSRPAVLDNGMTVVSVGIGFTKNAADAIGGDSNVGDERTGLLQMWALHQLERANNVFDISGTKVRFAIADLQRDVRETSIAERARTGPSGNASKWFDLEMSWHMHPATSPSATAALCHWNSTRANVYVLVGSFGGDLATGVDTSGRPLIEGACGWSGRPHGIVDPAVASTFEALLNDPAQTTGASSVPAPGTLAYSVVKQLCVEHHFTLAHELGHLFGAAHERASFSNPLEFAVQVMDAGAPSAFAFGHIDGSGASRRITVMSVGSRESDRLERTGQFSRFSGEAGALGAPDADNARVIRLIAPFLARRVPPVPNAETCSP